MTESIRKQIRWLDELAADEPRGTTAHKNYCTMRDTMEKLLAVYEAAQCIGGAAMTRALADALFAVQTRLTTVECLDCREQVEDIQTHCEREDNICLVRAPETREPSSLELFDWCEQIADKVLARIDGSWPHSQLDVCAERAIRKLLEHCRALEAKYIDFCDEIRPTDRGLDT